jgi:hypothetical protein
VSEKRRARPSLAVLESVRCLECGVVYSKPSGGNTVEKNPGCPECGYVGWLSAAVPLSGALAQRRSGADPQQPRRARSG